MEQVQYTASGHNVTDISDNSNNNTIADPPNPNSNLSMRIISSMMQYRKQSGPNGSMDADGFVDKSRNELKLLRCNAFHRSRVSAVNYPWVLSSHPVHDSEPNN